MDDEGNGFGLIDPDKVTAITVIVIVVWVVGACNDTGSVVEVLAARRGRHTCLDETKKK